MSDQPETVQLAGAKKGVKKEPPRAPSAYNLFMKAKIREVKKANPTMDHKTAFTKAAQAWATERPPH